MTAQGMTALESRRHPAVLATGAFVVAVSVCSATVAGCRGGEEREGSTSAQTSLPPASTAVGPTLAPGSTGPAAPPSPEDAVLAAVDAYWSVVRRANDPPDPDHPDLARVATGEALDRAVANIRDRQRLSRAVRLPERSRSRHHPRVVSLDGTRARVVDCAVDDSVLIDLPSGLTLNDAVETTEWDTEVELVDGVWRVSRNTITRTWDGAVSCGG